MKGRGKDQRTQEMIKNFFSMWKEGKTAIEIAECYGASRKTLYTYLQEIADENGVSRADLLIKPHKAHIMTKSSSNVKHEKVDEEKIKTEIDKMLSDVNTLICKILSVTEEAK